MLVQLVIVCLVVGRGMAILGLSSRSVAFIGFALFLAFYMDTSPPVISTQLSDWITNGKYMIFNGQKIFFREDKGLGRHRSAVICLHGFPTFSFDWTKMWPHLLKSFGTVIAPDFLGFGFSDKPFRHNYNILEQADMVESLLSQLGVREVHILAHDYGDTVAQELLARFEKRLLKRTDGVTILSVALLNGGIFPETNIPRFSQQILLWPYINQLLVKVMNVYTFGRGLNEVFGPETQLDSDEIGDYWAAILNNNGHVVIPRILGYIEERKLNRARWVGVLQSTSVPVHFIYGPADPVNPPPAFPDHFRELMSDKQLSVLASDIGHYPQLEAAADTSNIYFLFIKRISMDSTEAADNMIY